MESAGVWIYARVVDVLAKTNEWAYETSEFSDPDFEDVPKRAVD